MKFVGYFGAIIRSNRKLRRKARTIKMFFVRWRYRLNNVHSTFYLGGKADVANDLKAGAYSYVGQGCTICPKVEIGMYSYIAHNVTILGGDHRFDVPGVPICFSGRPDMPETSVGKDVWIGHRAIILAGVTIGNGSIVAAGAVVTRDVPNYSIVGGVPAIVIGRRFTDDRARTCHDAMLQQPPKEGDLPPPRVTGVLSH